MKQIYHKYDYWEDYKNGMYELNSIDKHIKVIKAIDVLCNNDIFYNACLQLIKDWPISSQVNLTNINQNRRAWLGAAACSYLHKVPEFITRIAWSLINLEHQEKANLIAEKIIKQYETENFGLHKNMGATMLF